MMNPDAVWAWTPFVPSESAPWNLRAAAHLYRRAGFGATRTELEAAVRVTPGEAVERLVNAVEPDDFLSQCDSLADAALATGNVQQLSAWWTYRILTTPAQLTEKTTLFWHGHFATSAAKVTDARLMLTQNELLRSYAFGDFSLLLLEISRDPAMLIYLDSAANRKAHPNENYAREIMELFCLGEGRYTETDIRELARCFTGWEIKRDKFRFNRYQHDAGVKSILGQSGPFTGEDGVQIVVSQDAAPEFLVTKLIRFFVADELATTPELIRPLAQQLRSDGMVIGPVLKRILSSNLFFSEYAVGRKVRSPVELAIGLLRCLDGSANTFELSQEVRTLGHGLFYPPSVKGWDGGRTWINSSTLLGRSNLIRQMLRSDKTRFARESLPAYLRSNGLKSGRQIVDHMELVLFAVPVSGNSKDRIIDLIEGRGPGEQNLIEGIHAMCTLPEFQLS